MSRQFNGASGTGIVTSIGSLGPLRGTNCSVVILWRSLAVPNAMGLFNTGPDGACGINPFSDAKLYYAASGFVATDATYDSSANYRVDAFTVNSGGTVRWHAAIKGTDTWTHSDRGSVSATGHDATSVLLGAISNSDTLNGRIAAIGIWVGTVLSDGQVEGMYTGLQAWKDANPTALWSFKNGATGSNPAVDRTGNGADETSKSGTSDSSDEPASFDYNLSSVVSGTLAAPLGTLTGALTGTVVVPATMATAFGGLTGALGGTVEVPATLAAPLGSLAAAMSGTRTVFGTLTGNLGALQAQIVGAQAVGAAPPFTTSTPYQVFTSQTRGGVL